MIESVDKETIEWINVKARLPDDPFQEVYFRFVDQQSSHLSSIDIGIYVPDLGWCRTVFIFAKPTRKQFKCLPARQSVTHWRPLPKFSSD